MIEIHAHTRPARPVLLPVVCAAALFSAVGLAWWQVEDARVLGDEIAISGSPLIVRVPREWVAASGTPGRFVLPGEGHDPRGAVTPEREIVFRHARLGTFVPPEQVIVQLNREQSAQSTAPEPARVGGMPGLQVRRIITVSFGRHVIQRETAMRVAVTPQGDVIHVEFTPLLELSTADLELLDRICASIRLADRPANAASGVLLKSAGVRFPIARDWEIYPPDFPEIAGVFVQALDDGRPVWVLGVHRTWIAPERAPADILADLAGTQWERADVLPQTSSAGTRQVLQIQCPRGLISMVASACLTSDEQGHAALIVAYADEDHAAVASQAALEAATALELTETPLLPDMKAAIQSGETLTSEIRKGGPRRDWGQEASETQYHGERLAERINLTRVRQPTKGSSSGYEGREIVSADRNRRVYDLVWKMDGRAESYTAKLQLALRSGGSFSMTEQRVGDEPRLRRIIDDSKATVTPIGARFVPPPAEILAELDAARRDDGAYLIEVSPLQPRTTMSRLMRPLPPDAAGNRRVLTQDDFDPRGAISAFNAAGELQYSVGPGLYLERGEER